MLAAGLGRKIGGMWESELLHYRDREWARTADDVLWRRTKMGLHMTAAERSEVAAWFGEATDASAADVPMTNRFASPKA